MKAVEELIEALKQLELVRHYRILSEKLLSDPNYQKTYLSLLDSQKAFVQSNHYQNSNVLQLKEKYQQYLDELTTDPLINQYLYLQTEVNALVKSITSLIESALSKPFDETL